MTITQHQGIEKLRAALTGLHTGMPATVNALSTAAEALLKEFDDQAVVEYRMALKDSGVKVPYDTREGAERGLAIWGKVNDGRVESRVVWKTGWGPA